MRRGALFSRALRTYIDSHESESGKKHYSYFAFPLRPCYIHCTPFSFIFMPKVT